MQMLAESRVLRLVGRVYDAAADPELWPAFLEDFADTVGGTSTGILVYDWSVQGANVGGVCVRFDPDSARSYCDHYNAVNPWMKSWKTHLNRAGPESIGTSEERVELGVLEKTEFYNDYLLPQDTIHQLGCFMTRTEKASAGFTCLRSRRTGPFGSAELELLRLLFPHLERGIQFQNKIAELQGKYRASLGALELLPNGVILLDDHGRILEVNCAAREILKQNDGLKIDKKELAASTPDQTKRLRLAIAAAARVAQGISLSASGSIGIHRPSGRRPFALMIMPSPVHAFPPEAERPAVIVFISDPEKKLKTAREVLERIYGLTCAEARLADQLVQGETLVHAAERLEVSHTTVRTHLQRIFEKTNTRHQGDLIRLLLSGIVRAVPGAETSPPGHAAHSTISATTPFKSIVHHVDDSASANAGMPS